MTTQYPIIDHRQLFEQAWNDARNTRVELPAVDINHVLAERYRLDKPLQFTRAMLWDMETKKARRPDLYIPHVVEQGSADAWADRKEPDGADSFVRKSRQRLWLEPEKRQLILEQTHLDHDRQQVTFIGAAKYPDREGHLLQAGTDQPIFHVVHGVDGEEERPLNTWFIVLLTDAPDARFNAAFERQARSPWLPEYLEIYIRDQLGIDLSRRGVQQRSWSSEAS